MNYKKYLKIIKSTSDSKVPERIWSRIADTLETKQHGSWFWQMFPQITLTAAAAVVVVVMLVNYAQRTALNSYLQVYSSTEYIYQICKYPG